MTEREKMLSGELYSPQDAELSAMHLKVQKLFEKYKGYYPYYYFFGNLKATKKKTTTSTSNSGVN